MLCATLIRSHLCQRLIIFVGVFSIVCDGFPQEIIANPANAREAERNGIPFCRVIRIIKRNIQKEFASRFHQDISCFLDPVNRNCSSFTCDIESWNVTIGASFNVCTDNATVKFWADSPLLGKWSQEFPVKPVEQSVQIKFPNNATQAKTYPPTLYLKVDFDAHLPHFGNPQLKPEDHIYLKLDARVEFTQNLSYSSINLLPFNVIRQAEFHRSQLCDQPVASAKPLGEALLVEPQGRSIDMSIPVKRVPFRAHGSACNINDMFSCGTGSRCRVLESAMGVCECLTDYIMTSYGTCEKNMNPIKGPTVEPYSSPTNNTYSSVLGAFVSIAMLMAIAAGIFFGTKYHFFSRLRNRLPSRMPLWPFRDMAIDDEVVMVDPLAPDDDEPPLL